MRLIVNGGSYGDFISFMALFCALEAFKAGAALRPVTDWTATTTGTRPIS
jgi:dipeptidyl aminopeptidase/acylaminoacyl peptidase